LIRHLNKFFDPEKKLGFSLEEWKKEWIQTAGLNECYPEFDPT
jgi:aminopeptidase N